jgi:hypothetical protein
MTASTRVPPPDQLKHGLATGRATLGHRGAAHELDGPVVVRLDLVEGRFAEKEQRLHRRFGVRDALVLRTAATWSACQGSSAALTATAISGRGPAVRPDRLGDRGQEGSILRELGEVLHGEAGGPLAVPRDHQRSQLDDLAVATSGSTRLALGRRDVRFGGDLVTLAGSAKGQPDLRGRVHGRRVPRVADARLTRR